MQTGPIWLIMLAEIKQLFPDLPLEGSRRLFEFWQQIDIPRLARYGSRTSVDQLRDLLIRLCEHRESYRIFGWQAEVPWTNDSTERVIGRMKDLS